MTRLRPLLVLLAIAAAAVAARAQTTSAESLLAAASEKATVEGDLKSAIALYQRVIDQYAGTDRVSTAVAMLRMADCYAKIGDDRASTTYAHVVNDFGDVASAASAARSRLAGLSTSIEPRRLCDECGSADASITPDGRSLVYADDDTGALSIRNLANNSAKVLAGETSAGRGQAYNILVSPDGKQIAYGWAPEGKDAVYELRITSSTPGAKPRVLRRDPTIVDLVPSGFAPDGRLVIQEQSADQRWRLEWLSPTTGQTTAIVSLGWRLSGDVHGASLSPNGAYIAFSAETEDPSGPPKTSQWPLSPTRPRHIYVVPAAGGAPLELKNTGQHNVSPVWLDNTRLLFTGDVNGTWDLWMATIRDGAFVDSPRLLKKGLGLSSAVGISRSGAYVFYKFDPGVTQSFIAAVPATGAAQQPLIGGRAAWSPDGASIALVRRRPPDASTIEIAVRNLATGDERVYSHDGLTGLAPVWYRDGKSLLVVVSDNRDDIRWYRVDLASGQFSRLAQQRNDRVTADWFSPALSLDGRTVYSGAFAVLGKPQMNAIVALDLTSGEFRDVAPLSNVAPYANPLALAISPDGSQLALIVADSSNVARVGVMSLDGRNYRELASVTNDNPMQKLSWTADGRFVFFSRRDASKDGRQRVMRIAVSGGQPEDMGVSFDDTERITVSPDGTRVLASSFRAVGERDELWSLDLNAILKALKPAGPAR